MEYRRRCNVCRKIFCYSDKDIEDNAKNTALSAISAIGTIASVFGGTRLDTYALGNRSERYGDKVIDLYKCPFCNSTNTSIITMDEWISEQNKQVSDNQNNGIIQKKIDINSNATEESLLKRTKMFLEEEDWESASAYCEQILDINPECSMAYVYKLMIEFRVSEQDKLALLPETFMNDKNYQKAIKFSDDYLRSELEGYNSKIIDRNNEKKFVDSINAFKIAKTEHDFNELIPKFKELGNYKNAEQMVHESEEKAILCKYNNALHLKQTAKTEKDFLDVKSEFDAIDFYLDSNKLSIECRDKAVEARKNEIYEEANSMSNSDSIYIIENAVKEFEKISGWRDADQKKAEALNRIEQLKGIEKRAIKKKKILSILIVFAIIICIIGIIVANQLNKIIKYNSANDKYNSGDYLGAIQIWVNLTDYRDSQERIRDAIDKSCDEAVVLINEGKVDIAKDTLSRIEVYLKPENQMSYDICMGYLILDDIINQVEGDEAINLTEIYDVVLSLPSGVDCSKFYNLDIIKKTEYLGTTWEAQKVIRNGKNDKKYLEKFYGYSFEGAQFIKIYNNGDTYVKDLYYKNGIFYAGPEISENNYTLIVEFDGVGDSTIIIKNLYSIGFSDGTRDYTEEYYTVERQ